ncbi:MAG TPA: enoyl-CoA hydratase-related protein, partial [Caulobacteraceae bacterium]|nr:enoyl-CoA hydratase-related protein [Caulobacteraceae bacterium]
EHQREQLTAHCDAIFAMVEALVDPRGRPRIAAIRGYCSGGGCETAFACDVVVACEDTRLALPEIKIGVLSSLAANLMARIAPAGRIFDMAMTGEWIDAMEAHDLGLVARVWGRADFDAELETYLQLYTSNSGEALSVGRRLLREALSRPLLTSLASLNQAILDEATVIDDYAEGVAAFLEKRPPVWTS